MDNILGGINLNEIINTHFEYSLVSDETARSLKAKKNQLDGIYFRYTSEVGQVLYEAQQELADYNNDGLFAKWVEAAGFKRQRAYEYINIYKYAVRITDNDELEIFEKQPKSIQTEMSKPSAKPEINQMVYDGEITKHKDYIEREREFKEKEEKLNQRLKQQSEIIENKNSVIAKQSEELGKLRKQEPQVIEKEVVVEKIPDDYAGLQESHSYLTDRLLKAEQDLKLANSKYDLLKSSTAEAKELKQQIDSLKGEQNSLMKAIDATKDLHQLEQDFNEFFDKHMAPMKFKGINQYLTTTTAPDRIHALIDLAQAWVDEMQRLVPKNRKIIEGDFEDE